MINRIQEEFTWPELKGDVTEWITVCPTCAERKLHDQRKGQPDNKETMEVSDQIYANLLGPINPMGEADNRYVLTLAANTYGHTC